MKTYSIEDLSDDDLLSLLISEAHECSVPSESNTLSSIRDELKLRLTRRAVDGANAPQFQRVSPADVRESEAVLPAPPRN